MKVNMTPNPLDVVTIHASQGDTEARQWEFELHNNGELIDTSEIKEQLVFKAYKGGTEQLLPENGSTPTTSPFKGDIRYPQGLLTDQEFTYRQSPTEEDGLAKITDIKGNTINWNQLVQNGNFADGTNNWTSTSGGTISASNGVLTYEVTEVGTSTTSNRFYNSTSLLVDHTYLCLGEFSSTKANAVITARRTTTSNTIFRIDLPNANTWYKASGIATMNANGSNLSFTYNNASSIGEVGDKIYARNIMLFDLTQMGQDSLTAEEFTSLFPLPFYDFTKGNLLSFNGTGLKTVGFNQWDEEWEVGAISAATGANTSSSSRIRSKNYIPVLSDKTYYCKAPSNLYVFFYDNAFNFLGYATSNKANTTFEIEHNASYIRFRLDNTTEYENNVCINISSSRNGEYEPYTSSTLSLPISTYFPSGMKSAGNVYDELTESKAITRIDAVDLGSLNWGYLTSGSVLAPYFVAIFSGIKSQGNPAVNKANMICSKYQTVARNETYFVDKTICADGSPTVLSQIQIKDSSFTDATAFKSAMSGVYLYYELATPTETSLTTASLVTENAEIPLSNEDGTLIGKCTEQLSENPGFIDAKIKLSDADGACYSNKLQLHIERSPQ